ncbi:MAG: PepSY domain-containing protein [Phenylobacterium sp.]|uniref:PepSY domain-containing protein n=1 Tax=Phenylobacterium sp. TaxID=1871053 RepID=UPI001A207F31|nr:PepSY domain-containing protein [Phenylobacterium sp.]MBJ7412216.1 PepSY domain-containing protein [Phenylobacterium sp.]
MFLIRWLHKWFGLVLGLQFLLWAVSGAAMALLDHHKVSGEHAVLPVAQLAAPPQPLALAQVSEQVGAPIVKLQLKPLFDTWIYEATTPHGVRLLDAATGAPIVVDAEKAKALAVARYSGDAAVTSVKRISETTLETRDVALPVWRVEFGDAEHTTLLMSEASGELLGIKTDSWRLWDVAWMLHIMDYSERQSFNHPLIVTVGTGVAWLALSGLILLFRSFRRADVAWILDPIDELRARRRAAAPVAKDGR